MEKTTKGNGLNIKITSWNVRGIRKLNKLKQVLDRLKYLKSKIIFLQESHLIESEIHWIIKRWQGQVYHSSFTSHARGVIILIHKSITFQIIRTIKDPYGRYIIVQGHISTLKLNLINIYGPNNDNPSFYENLFLTLSTLEGFYIIGGDFNCTLNPSLDKSTQIDTSHSQTRNMLLNYIKDLRINEVWRTRNPTNKEFSCYSSSHQYHSRIDYFLISVELLPHVENCWYNSIVISDHAAVSLEIKVNKIDQGMKRWRMQTLLLKDSKFVTFIETCIDQYFEMNKDETTASIRWEAFKAYIRGEIISYSSNKNKQYNQELKLLERQIKSSEAEVYQSNDQTKLHKLNVLRTRYDKLTTEKVAKNLMWTKQAFYDQGEKAGKLLAWRIKQMQAERTINSIKSKLDILTTDPSEINENFREFYKNLYKSEYSGNKDTQAAFLNQLKFKTLLEEEKTTLDSPLTIEDLSEAIDSMNSGKTPGPDGLPIEFYKTFKNKLILPLLNMYEESYEAGILPDSLRLATITLLLKPNKPSTECSSYRGISLMGCDTKILCKALSRRLDKYLPTLIIDDQQGFIKARQGYHNIRRVLNVLHEKHNCKDTAMLSLDARQAFDRIEWDYLFEVLPKYGFGETFLKWIRLLYTDPKAQVLTNNNMSKLFNLQRSTRQGCPLSPLLFVLAIEPLAMAVRANTGISGIRIGGRDHLISLFVDHTIFFMSNLKISIPKLLHLIKEFCEFSGYTINNSKSELMFLNEEERRSPIVTTPFKTTTKGFTYLGIKVTPSLNEISITNYNPLVEKVTEMLNRWSNLPISIIGRINLLKMTILPKFLYYFQTLPLPLSDSFYDSLDKLFNQFIWSNRKARLRLKLLYLPYERGGLQVPNLRWYYMAAQLTSATHYFCPTTPPAWVDIEQQSVPDFPLNTFLYSSDLKTLKKTTKKPFLKNTIINWYAAHKHVGEHPELSQFAPIWGNERFIPGKNDGGFKLWKTKGIQKIKDLYVDGKLLTFDQLCKKYLIPPKHSFKYLQLKNFMSSKLKQIVDIPPLTKIEEVCVGDSKGKGFLSVFYNLLMLSSRNSAIDKLDAWRRDTFEDIDEEDWNQACLKAQKQTINTRFKLLQYKWLMRTYITPVKLHHMSSDIPDTCTKCLFEKGTLLHCLWECLKIQKFWKDVIGCLSELFKVKVPLEVKICVLGIYPVEFKQLQRKTKLTSSTQKIYSIMLERHGCTLPGTLEEGNCKFARTGKANIHRQG
uniref:Reverse transcriptase domain-containing protein n=1 Tax=Xiphophorus maculatus TaxID=8083 RepID=A0A3B5R0Z3_XIPMA